MSGALLRVILVIQQGASRYNFFTFPKSNAIKCNAMLWENYPCVLIPHKTPHSLTSTVMPAWVTLKWALRPCYIVVLLTKLGQLSLSLLLGSENSSSQQFAMLVTWTGTQLNSITFNVCISISISTYCIYVYIKLQTDFNLDGMDEKHTENTIHWCKHQCTTIITRRHDVKDTERENHLPRGSM